ncbi:MAG: hypothetical protein OEW75_07150 [Cyclobacteriaceae bacterium]|nr:hypothetical protein [Cyclobacteriaceae bacterium]
MEKYRDSPSPFQINFGTSKTNDHKKDLKQRGVTEPAHFVGFEQSMLLSSFCFSIDFLVGHRNVMMNFGNVK